MKSGDITRVGRQVFTCIGFEDYVARNYRHIELVKLESRCADCGAPFTCKASRTAAKRKDLSRRCELHRSPGRKVAHVHPAARKPAPADYAKAREEVAAAKKETRRALREARLARIAVQTVGKAQRKEADRAASALEKEQSARVAAERRAESLEAKFGIFLDAKFGISAVGALIDVSSSESAPAGERVEAAKKLLAMGDAISRQDGGSTLWCGDREAYLRNPAMTFEEALV